MTGLLSICLSMYSTLSVHTSSSIQLAVCLTIADYCKSFVIYLRTIFFSPIPLPTILLFLAPTCLLSYPCSTLLLSHLSTLLPSSSPLPSLHYPLVPPLLSPHLPNYLPLLLPPLHATTLPYGTSRACGNILCAQFCAGAAEGGRHCKPLLLQQPGLVNMHHGKTKHT